MTFEFDSIITQLEGNIKWNVFYFPYSVTEHFGTKGTIPVRITVDGFAFDHTLLPSQKGHYLVYNEFIRHAVCKQPGNSVHVTLEQDACKREFIMPADLEEALLAGGVLDVFLRQPDYLKREQANAIALAKKDETKQNRTKALIEKLSRNRKTPLHDVERGSFISWFSEASTRHMKRSRGCSWRLVSCSPRVYPSAAPCP